MQSTRWSYKSSAPLKARFAYNSPSHFQTKYATYTRDHISDSIAPSYLSWAYMVEIMGKLKLGKSSSGRIRPEHVLHGSTKLVLHLHLLYNAMIQHGMVVADLLLGTITPIVKDSIGDINDSSNYREITIGSLFSKLFGFAIDLKVWTEFTIEPLSIVAPSLLSCGLSQAPRFPLRTTYPT